MDIVYKANELLSLPKNNELNTKMVREISATLYRSLEDKSISKVLPMCEELLKNGDWALKIIAFDIAFRVRKQYNREIFSIFEGWLINYVKNWDDCDDFCTHAFGELLRQYPDLFKEIIKWTNNPNFAVRRAAPVILIYPIKHNEYYKFNPFLISDLLMNDEHYLVQKGYGWMLKVLSIYEKERVYQYLVENKEKMPRTAFRYALEKFDSHSRSVLMSNEEKND